MENFEGGPVHWDLNAILLVGIRSWLGTHAPPPAPSLWPCGSHSAGWWPEHESLAQHRGNVSIRASASAGVRRAMAGRAEDGWTMVGAGCCLIPLAQLCQRVKGQEREVKGGGAGGRNPTIEEEFLGERESLPPDAWMSINYAVPPPPPRQKKKIPFHLSFRCHYLMVFLKTPCWGATLTGWPQLDCKGLLYQVWSRLRATPETCVKFFAPAWLLPEHGLSLKVPLGQPGQRALSVGRQWYELISSCWSSRGR